MKLFYYYRKTWNQTSKISKENVNWYVTWHHISEPNLTRKINVINWFVGTYHVTCLGRRPQYVRGNRADWKQIKQKHKNWMCHYKNAFVLMKGMSFWNSQFTPFAFNAVTFLFKMGVCWKKRRKEKVKKKLLKDILGVAPIIKVLYREESIIEIITKKKK